MIGCGLVNSLINNLPVELHLPGYQYCGPGTKLSKRLARGDPGINPLDTACKQHDIAYSKEKSLEARTIADKVLAEQAWKRVFAKDAGIAEKASAWGVANIMKAKTKLGMGQKVAKISAAKKTSKARKGAKQRVGSKRRTARVLPAPRKIGGFLPLLLPIFAGLSAAGALLGGAANIAEAVNAAQAAKRELDESKRHNKMMEAAALGKGLHLKPYKRGSGSKNGKSRYPTKH